MPIRSSATVVTASAPSTPNDKHSFICNHCNTGDCCTHGKSSVAGNNNDPRQGRQQRQQTGQPNPISSLLTCRTEEWVDISSERLPNSRLGSLYPGSRFQGVQHCGTACYDVAVEIQHVDLKESTLCGYLKISGLTSEYPELTTFFQAEIIGSKYSFLTRKWQAQKSIDASHWKRFPSFEPYLNVFNNDDFMYEPYDKDFVYMRWKEQFLVPDHRVSNIDGASFEGFYYICYQRSTDEIKGYYYFSQHSESSRFQELQLKHVVDRSFGNYEMR